MAEPWEYRLNSLHITQCSFTGARLTVHDVFQRGLSQAGALNASHRLRRAEKDLQVEVGAQASSQGGSD
jgi:hypothetical protein